METTKKLTFNRLKFEHDHLSSIRPFVSSLYNNKEVEFHIVNLKGLHLHTDIFTQIIANKLKNRDNKLLRVLKSALFLVKIAKVNKIKEIYVQDNRAKV